MHDVEATLVAALRALGQSPPENLVDAPLADIWTWAQEHWRIDVLRGQTAVAYR
jgi:glutamyl-Q tRNA(Asp) synthetase